MLHVQCFGCGTSAYTDKNSDPDSALECPEDAPCCKQDHSHGQAGCRPVKITVMPGSVTMHRATGG